MAEEENGTHQNSSSEEAIAQKTETPTTKMPPERSKLRVAFDLTLLGASLAALCAAGYYYWRGLEERTPPEVILQADVDGIDLAAMMQMVRNTPASADLPEWSPSELSNRWQQIILHHSATLSGNAAAFDNEHRKRGMNNSVGYHFVILNGSGGEDGKIEICPRWSKQLDGGHLKGNEANKTAIGICLVGDFTRQPPTPRQIASLKALLKHLMKITLITPVHVQPHSKVPQQSTVCPGLLPVDLILQTL